MESEQFLFWFIFAIIILVCIVVAVVAGNVSYFTSQEAMGKDPDEE